MNNNFNVNNNNVNNQNYNFDPMTGQPIQNYNNVNNNKNKNNKIIIILVAIIIIGMCIFAYTKVMKSSDEKTQPDTQQTQQNSTNQSNSNNNTSGTVDPNTDLTNDKTGAFLMPIEDVFTISGRGTVVTGRIERGTINIGDTIQIIGLNHEITTTTVLGIEMFRKELDYAEAGDNAGIVLKDVAREDVERGQVLAQPNSIKASTKFDAEVYILSKDEGGRHTPFFNNYRPQFYFKTTDITGVITLPDNIEMVNPGENVTMTVELISNIAMEKGTTFSIREGGRTVGSGTVTKVY